MCSSLDSAFPVLGDFTCSCFSMGVNSMCCNCIWHDDWFFVKASRIKHFEDASEALKIKVSFNKPDPNYAKGIKYDIFCKYIQLPSTSQEDLLMSSVSCSWIGSLASFTAFRRSRKERRPEPELSKRRNLGVSVNHNLNYRIDLYRSYSQLLEGVWKICLCPHLPTCSIETSVA